MEGWGWTTPTPWPLLRSWATYAVLRFPWQLEFTQVNHTPLMYLLCIVCTICPVALTLSYLATEYMCLVWERSKHARKLDSTLDKCCRIITGCLKPTRTDHLHILAGIAPPGIRRAVTSQSEQVRQLNDPRHPMFQHTPETSRLISRSSFISSTAPLNDSTSHTCTCL